MKKTVLSLVVLCCFFVLGCKEQDNNNNSSQTGCVFENPLTDLAWLKAKVNEFNSPEYDASNPKIYRCVYKTNQIGFIVELDSDSPNMLYVLHSCKGEVLCNGGGFVGESICQEFNIDYNSKVLIYQRNN